MAGSPSHPDVLFRGAVQAFTFDGPSFVHVLAPEPGLHGYPTDRTVERARMAVRARVQPLLRYDPAADGVFGLRLDLDGNPATADLLAPAAADAVDGDAPEPASWAAFERRYAKHLRTLDDREGGVPFARWSTLSPDARNADVPTVPGPNGRRLGVGVTLSAAALRRVHHWRTLQELAGLETPFTERIRERIEGEAEVARSEALDELRQHMDRPVAAHAVKALDNASSTKDKA